MIIATGLQVVMGAASVIEQNNLSWAVRAFAGDYSTSLIVCMHPLLLSLVAFALCGD